MNSGRKAPTRLLSLMKRLRWSVYRNKSATRLRQIALLTGRGGRTRSLNKGFGVPRVTITPCPYTSQEKHFLRTKNIIQGFWLVVKKNLRRKLPVWPMPMANTLVFAQDMFQAEKQPPMGYSIGGCKRLLGSFAMAEIACLFRHAGQARRVLLPSEQYSARRCWPANGAASWR